MTPPTKLCTVCGEPESGYHKSEESNHCPRCKEYVGFMERNHGIEDCLEIVIRRAADLRERVKNLEDERARLTA